MKISEIYREVKGNGRECELWDAINTSFDNMRISSPSDYDKALEVFMQFIPNINIKTQDELEKHLAHIHHPLAPKLWTVEETTKLGESIGVDFDEWRYNKFSWNYVCNMMRSDFYKELEQAFHNNGLLKQVVLENPTFYAHLAKAWLDDADAPSDKLIQYLGIVEGK